MDLFEKDTVINQKIDFSFPLGVELYVKREDLLHQEVSGNKFRKLKYNLLKAKELGVSKVLTFGGAYSNHIAATAAACKLLDLQCVGIIRGEEIASKYHENPTLIKALRDGMQLHFVSRSWYREKTQAPRLLELEELFGDFLLVPEGGSNELAILGAQEILKPTDNEFDYICCPVGTGGTIAGLIRSSKQKQMVLGYPALKEDFLIQEIMQWTDKTNWKLVRDYHFGGYAKINDDLLDFIRKFEKDFAILLDPIYTGKMLYGILQDIQMGRFKENSKILAVHTGGLQGWNNITKGIK